MRLNLKRVTAFGVLIGLLWVIVSYSSLLEFRTISSVKPNIKDLETKINKLERQISDQVNESHKLLEKINGMKKTENEMDKDAVDVSGNNEDDMNNNGNPVLPVLVISCNRVTVKRCLDNLIKFRPSKETFPIIVSQDCGHNATYQVIRSYVDADPSSVSVVLQPDLSEIALPEPGVKLRGYYKIARHYRFALNHVFRTLGHEAVIIIEDDLDISPDLFEYFLGTYPLLLKDPSLWCVSAWNDNGKRELIDTSRPELLHRTDFFPGLGWLLRRASWLRLEPKWPDAFFDDWLRNPANTDGRACIRPEISRTYSFGKVGVSNGLYFDGHLRHIHLNTEHVEFTKLNLTYLLKENYDRALEATLASLPTASAAEAVSGSAGGGGSARAVRVPYSDAKGFQRAAKKLGLMSDFRSGVPRTAYRGVVACFVRGRRVYLAPDKPWTKYDPAWG